MCIFSREVTRISDTCIYGRLATDGQQFLAYQLSAALDQEMAMILPLPVAPTAQTPLQFLDLSDCPLFFSYLNESFGMRSRSRKPSLSLSLPTLEVVEVGSFQASFVPSIRDFERLDPRFRLDTSIWQQLPRYSDFGFAVFKLKEGDQKLHPMAFRFHTRYADKLFFPSVHVHDGTVPKTETFDHRLFCQSGRHPGEGWHESNYMLGDKIPANQDFKELINTSKKGYRMILKGEFPNNDVVVDAEPLEVRRASLSEPGLRKGLSRKHF